MKLTSGGSPVSRYPPESHLCLIGVSRVFKPVLSARRDGVCVSAVIHRSVKCSVVERGREDLTYGACTCKRPVLVTAPRGINHSPDTLKWGCLSPHASEIAGWRCSLLRCRCWKDVPRLIDVPVIVFGCIKMASESDFTKPWLSKHNQTLSQSPLWDVFVFRMRQSHSFHQFHQFWQPRKHFVATVSRDRRFILHLESLGHPCSYIFPLGKV